MSVTRFLRTITTINYNVDQTVDIILNYDGNELPCSDNIPHIKQSAIALGPLNINGTAINEGDAYVVVVCYPDYIQVIMDQTGQLLVTVYDDRELFYTIDPDTGELNFTS